MFCNGVTLIILHCSVLLNTEGTIFLPTPCNEFTLLWYAKDKAYMNTIISFLI